MPDALEPQLDALWGAAKEARAAEQFAAAAELLSPYLRHRPGHGWAWHWYGDALGNLGLRIEAERALLRAIGLVAEPFWSHVRLARLYRHFGDHGSADVRYAMAANSTEGQCRGWVWIQRGANLARLNRLDEAIACHRHALSLGDADHDEAHLNLGLILRARGQYGAAATEFRFALSITPDYPEASAALGSIDGVAEALRLANATPPPPAAVSE